MCMHPAMIVCLAVKKVCVRVSVLHVAMCVRVSVLHVAMSCCSVLQCVAARCSVCVLVCYMLRCVCVSVLHVAKCVRVSVLHVAMSCWAFSLRTCVRA